MWFTSTCHFLRESYRSILRSHGKRVTEPAGAQTLVRKWHFRAKKALPSPEKQRLWEDWQLSRGRAAGEATTLGTRPISAHVKQMEKILRDVKGIGRIKSGGLVHKDKFAHNEWTEELGFIELTKGKEMCAAVINVSTSSLGAMNNQAWEPSTVAHTRCPAAVGPSWALTFPVSIAMWLMAKSN